MSQKKSLAGSNKYVVLCLRVETEEYAVQLNFKEKEIFVFQKQETLVKWNKSDS